jgi:hypothetical protein
MTRMFRCIAVAVTAVAPLLAQDTVATGPTADRICYHARPKPACSVFFLTNAGVYMLTSTNAHVGSTPARALVDWGVMVNVGRQDAIGASFFGVGDFDGFTGGPAVRYRRWLRGQASLDVAVGTSIVAARSVRTNPITTGSLYGLLKWNPEPWLGFAARPELIHRTIVTSCGPSGCTVNTQSQRQLSFGVELGGVPGLILSGPAIFVSAVAAALAGTN